MVLFVDLHIIDFDFAVCKVNDIRQVDFSREFVFLLKTDDEISLVCESAYVPLDATACEADWKALRVSGTLDFGMVGVIAEISYFLAEANISIFVISTYNADYVFMKADKFDKGIHTLGQNGYVVKQVR